MTTTDTARTGHPSPETAPAAYVALQPGDSIKHPGVPAEREGERGRELTGQRLVAAGGEPRHYLSAAGADSRSVPTRAM
jgi:hypothetical protein